MDVNKIQVYSKYMHTYIFTTALILSNADFRCLVFFSQWVLCDSVSAGASTPQLKGGRGRSGGDPPGGVAPEAPADPRLHQTHGRTLPPKEEDHGQPL